MECQSVGPMGEAMRLSQLAVLNRTLSLDG